MSVTFQDGVTPLNAVNLNTLESKASKGVANGYASLDGSGKVPAAQLSNALPADTVVAAATRIIANLRAGGDTQPSFRFFGDGKHEWGPGGSTAPDTNLYRSAAGIVRTDGRFAAADTSVTFHSNPAVATGYSLYSQVGAEAQPRFALYTTGQMAWGPGGSTSVDTNLYRTSAANLKTDGTLWVGASVIVDNVGGAPGANKLYFGSAIDTSLYRSAAGKLKTDGDFLIGGNLCLGASTVSGAVGGGQPYKFPVYSSVNGGFLGYVPIYAS